MNIAELKELIKDLPDDMLVVMSSDGEGNSFSPSEDYSIGKWIAESTWCGSLWQNPKNDPDFNPDDWDEEDFEEPEDAQDAFCLWPVN